MFSHVAPLEQAPIKHSSTSEAKPYLYNIPSKMFYAICFTGIRDAHTLISCTVLCCTPSPLTRYFRPAPSTFACFQFSVTDMYAMLAIDLQFTTKSTIIYRLCSAARHNPAPCRSHKCSYHSCLRTRPGFDTGYRQRCTRQSLNTAMYLFYKTLILP